MTFSKREVFIWVIGLCVGLVIGATALGGTPAQAMQQAVADLSTMPVIDRPWQRYVWMHDKRVCGRDAAIAKFVVNTAISRASTLVDPVMVNEQLMRWDVRKLSQDVEDAENILNLWERLREDPYFHASVDDTFPWAPHVFSEARALQGNMGDSFAGIVRVDWFVSRVFTTTNGGLYYDFTEQRGKSFGEVLAFIGADLERAQNVRADERAAIFASKVTGKPRRIDVFTYAGVRPSAGIGLVTITRDVTDDQVGKTDFDPIRNLLKFRTGGGEAIIQRRNGTHLFTIFNSSGTLLDVAPDTVATDSTGRQHTVGGTRLQAAVSCVRCHAEDGYRPFKNDVQTLLRSGLDIYGDLSSKNSQLSTVDRLAGLYGGTLDGVPRSPIQRARDDYAWTVAQITEWPMNDVNGSYAVPQLAVSLSRQYARYQYDLVTASVVLQEVGLGTVKNDVEALTILRERLPILPVAADGVSPEDPIIAAIRLGIPITRGQWESVYSDVMSRITETTGG